MTDSVREAWQASGAEPALPPLDRLRAGADAFHRKIRIRNAIEYAASALVILFFGAFAILSPYTVPRIGAAMIVIGTFIVAWQLHSRASAVAPPDAGALPILLHQRAQLVRQHAALSHVGLWYLGPLVPGLFVLMFAPAISHGLAGLRQMGAGGAFAVAINLVVLGGIWWLNQRVARKLKKMIDEIDDLTGDAR